VISILKRSVHKVLNKAGLQLVRNNRHLPNLRMALQRLHDRNPKFETVIDIGASDGNWSEDVMEYFPQKKYFLIEAQPLHEASLKKFCSEHTNTSYVLAAAGAKEFEIFFEANDPYGGVASYENKGVNSYRVPVTTVDIQVKEKNLKGPFLIKLDTHGFEIPILNGAEETLKNTEVLIIECYNFKLSPECLKFYEMCQYLETKGFRCIDLYDPSYRALDNTFWQMDIVFMKDPRPEFLKNTYR